LNGSTLRYLMVLGRPGEPESGGPQSLNHLSSHELAERILKSKLVISRSGYSTIMDLVAVGGAAVFIPTPGQTEQEYLAVELERLGVAFHQNQEKFDLKQAMEKATGYTGFAGWQMQPNLLTSAIDNILNELK